MHVLNSSQVTQIVCELDAKDVCNGSRRMASGAEPTMAERMNQAWLFEIGGRGLIVVDVGRLPLQLGDGWILRGASSTESARCCGFFAVWHAYGCRVETSSGCDGVSRMASCCGGRDGGGGAGASAKPCLRWVPFARLDDGRPWRLLYCDGAYDLCSSSSRANALLYDLLTDDCRSRVDAWACLLQRVPRVTTVLGRRCVHGLVPYSAPCPR